VYAWCRENRHLPVRQQHEALTRRVQGHINYFGVGAADRAAILRVRVPPRQLLVLGAKRYHGLGQVTNQEVAWCKRPGRRWGESPNRWVQSGGLASVGA
jgi:hypothetical protein